MPQRLRPPAPIGVITPTVPSDRHVHRAIWSVINESPSVRPIRHVIVGDDFLPSLSVDVVHAGKKQGVEIVAIQSPFAGDNYRPSRIARTRNDGLSMTRDCKYLAFLDSDNKFAFGHLAKHVKILENNPDLDAVYSDFRLFNANGTPWRRPKVPWKANESQAFARYLELCERGNMAWYSNIVRNVHQLENASVDSNCWVLRRDVLDKVPWPTNFSAEQKAANLVDDRAFLRSLVDAGVSVRGSGLDTVNYYLDDKGITRTAAAEAGASMASHDSRALQIELLPSW